jgi:thiol-disulfide isomerase/thioredoxin
MDLDPPLIHAPDFSPSTWINTPEPLSLADLRGRVLLVDFWDFTCINCLRGLPYLREWQARYEETGLTIVGVHTPEFAFARNPAVVRSAAGRLGVRYPVVLDNDQQLWTAYATNCWPTLHLIDPQGYIRWKREGEGGYDDTERAIHELLRERTPDVILPDPVAPIRPEDAQGAVCLPITPELQMDSLGNGALSEEEATHLNILVERSEGRIYAGGHWRGVGDGMILESEGGALVVPYQAASVQVVLAPAVDPEGPTPDPPLVVEISQDGRPLPPDQFGEDVSLRGGVSRVAIDGPRLYNLVRDAQTGHHELRLDIPQPGLVYYAFSFGRCLAPRTEPAIALTE